MINKTIVIFGATGLLGSHIAVNMRKAGFGVVAVGHRKSDNGFFADYDIPYFSVDISKQSDFDVLPQHKIWAVLHFAGALPASMSGYDPYQYVDSIVKGTLNVLEYTRRINADRIIFPQSLFDVSYLFGSTIPIPADSIRKAPLTGDHSVYVIAKNMAVDMIEHYYSTYGIKRFILRLSRVYSYHPNPYTFTDGKRVLISDRYLIYRAMQGLPLEIWGDPKRVLETCSMRDFLQIVEKATTADCDGGIYNIGSGGTTLEERILGIADFFSPSDKKPVIEYHPEKKDCTQFVLDIQKTIKDLGYTPDGNWLHYLEDFEKEMREQTYAKLFGYEKDFYQL